MLGFAVMSNGDCETYRGYGEAKMRFHSLKRTAAVRRLPFGSLEAMILLRSTCYRTFLVLRLRHVRTVGRVSQEGALR